MEYVEKFSFIYVLCVTIFTIILKLMEPIVLETEDIGKSVKVVDQF